MAGTYKKLSIPEVREEIAPLFEKYQNMIEIYKSSNAKVDFLANLLENETN